MKVYEVNRIQGEYESRTVTTIAAYFDKGMAETHKDKANERYLQLVKAGVIYNITEYGSAYDPNLLYADMTLKYTVKEIEVSDSFPNRKENSIPVCEICKEKVVDGTIYIQVEGDLHTLYEWKACCEDCGESQVEQATTLSKVWSNTTIPIYTDQFTCFSNDSSFPEIVAKMGEQECQK